MTLVMFGTIVFLATLVLSYRRDLEERTIRWRIYALRDELRWLAYEDEPFRKSGLFLRLDSSFSLQCTTLENLSLWTIGTVLIVAKMINRNAPKEAEIDHARIMRELAKPEHEKVRKLYMESCGLIFRHLVIRHILLSVLAGVTLLPGLIGFFMSRWLSARLMSGAITVRETRYLDARQEVRLAS